MWELLTCEIPYKNLDQNSIMWGVGSNKLKLPIPNSAPEGIKILLQQCLSIKPRYRPSFSHILKHLDVVSNNEIILKLEQEYHKNQLKWKEEINEKMIITQSENLKIQPYNYEDDLIQKRKEELKHATDIRELYEQKLEKANNLYMELNTVLLQLDERERELLKREKTFDIHNKKVVRPILRREFQNFNDNLISLKYRNAGNNNNNNNNSNGNYYSNTNSPDNESDSNENVSNGVNPMVTTTTTTTTTTVTTTTILNNNGNSKPSSPPPSNELVPFNPNTNNSSNKRPSNGNEIKALVNQKLPDLDVDKIYLESYLYRNKQSSRHDAGCKLHKKLILNSNRSCLIYEKCKLFKSKFRHVIDLDLNFAHANHHKLSLGENKKFSQNSLRYTRRFNTGNSRKRCSFQGAFRKKLNRRINFYLNVTSLQKR